MQAPVIDFFYRKDTKLPPGKGYSMRPGGIKPTAIVIHTTNSSHKNTVFADEARFLRDSVNVGAHFLVGKQGQIAQILSPDLGAWQAGQSVSAFANDHSIGIESHVSVGEQWTGAQRDALTQLVRWLMAVYHIAPEQIETHRKIALPLGRKSDPEAWPDAAFYAWRAALVTPPPVAAPKKYRAPGVPIFQASTLTGALAGYLTQGEVVTIDARAPLPGYAPNAGHVIRSDGTAPGFVDCSLLEEVT